MEFLRPSSWREALAAKAARPDAVPIAGGTDVMVELNFDHRRPATLLDLTGIDGLASWSDSSRGDSSENASSAGEPMAAAHDSTGSIGGTGSTLRIGAGLPYGRLIDELGDRLPGLAIASRTVGSAQIRNRGTLGNFGSASPAGDAHPPLLASDAEVEVESLRGRRALPLTEFFTGVKRNALADDELIAAVRVNPATGPQQFAKIGTRNAMVIAVCAFALALHPEQRRVGTGLGAAAPTPIRALRAEEFLNAELAEHWDAGRELPSSLVTRFGELVAQAATPIDDVRGSARYRSHALGVLARRTLTWAWNEHCTRRLECA